MNYQSTTNAPQFQDLAINNGRQEQFFCFDIILQKIHERIKLMTERYSRVMFVRFDIRFPRGYQAQGGNDEVSHLFKMMKENARTRKTAFHFVWVREKAGSDNPHYHAIALLDASRSSNYIEFIAEVTRVWGHVLNCHAAGLIDRCDFDSFGNYTGNGIILQRPIRRAIGEDRSALEQDFWAKLNWCNEWASYLAKVNQKEDTPYRVRRFGASKI
ncbi:conserved protein of unknown function [Pseudodesulfovibrio profundus]|uniref:YagK/YfjJ C-terminal domain-containing protein n=1 Tax=Pseudodesulfovibrio profundus TaxID=57320 RepID=A0A2C8FC14_9BACT|nr:inovirus-type Gp2 protein [Pseudodesulfovibrio profundus]SOB59989.1 conserved protein of unknown function [Pseudodesulfovibrio profundus]